MFYMAHSTITLKFDYSPREVATIRNGLPSSLFEDLGKRYGLSQGVMLEATGIPRSSAHRYKVLGKLNKEQSNRLYRVMYLLQRAEELFGNPEQATKWLTAPSVFLHDSSPLAYLDTEPGFKAVEHFLGRLEDGIVT
jgi:putative toxin-antitoxin system antitoxin component (TIGR02293 family)